MPTYTKQEFYDWMMNQELFHELHKEWEQSNYQTKLSPSVDRLDDYKGYSFDNIQLMTWEENRIKSVNDRVHGVNNKASKAVLQYDLEGNFIKEYYSINKAERETGVFDTNIHYACNGSYKQAGGFIWKYKNSIS